MDDKVLEQVYQESLDERLISYLAEENNISLEKAMAIYYESKLSNKINQGNEGIQYLDYKVLADLLKETEPELFDKLQQDKKVMSIFSFEFKGEFIEEMNNAQGACTTSIDSYYNASNHFDWVHILFWTRKMQ